MSGVLPSPNNSLELQISAFVGQHLYILIRNELNLHAPKLLWYPRKYGMVVKKSEKLKLGNSSAFSGAN